jgi:hypothetical protein
MERAYESSEARQYNPQQTNSFRGKLLLLLVCYVYFILVTEIGHREMREDNDGGCLEVKAV